MFLQVSFIALGMGLAEKIRAIVADAAKALCQKKTGVEVHNVASLNGRVDGISQMLRGIFPFMGMKDKAKSEVRRDISKQKAGTVQCDSIVFVKVFPDNFSKYQVCWFVH